MSRSRSVNYDQVIQQQRELMYDTRNRLLDGGGMDEKKLLEIAEGNISRFVRGQSFLTLMSLHRYILDHISYRLDGKTREISLDDASAVEEYLMKRVCQGLEEKKKKTGSQVQLNRFMRIAALNAIDSAWIEQVDYLQQMQAAISGRALAQRNLLFEFQKDGLEAFEKMELTILENIMRNILLSNVYMDADKRIHILFP